MRGPERRIPTEILARCPACGSAAFFPEIESRDFEGGTGEYRVECCRKCGMRFTNPQPASDTLFDLYRDRNSADYVRSHSTSDRLRALAIRRWIHRVLEHCDRIDTVLDYGCGDGFFSAQLSRCTAFEDITAVDLHDRPPPCLDGLASVHYGSFEQLQTDENRYHLIFCRHVVEHMADPNAAAAELTRLLAPGGTLVVEVPNYQSVWRRVFGRYYFGLHLPRHLLHFDEHSLKATFRKYRLLKLYRNHTPVLGQSLGYLSGLPIGNLGMVGLGLFPLQVLVDSAARSSSVLSLVVRKQER